MRLHLWKRSWTTLEETPNHSRCRAFHWHPVHNTYQIALMTARSEALGLPPRRVLFFVCLGRHFLSFLHRGRGRLKKSTLLVVVASFIRRISFENGDISESILGEMRLCSRAMKWFSDRLLGFLGSSQRPMSRRRAYRFRKIGNLSAGVAALCGPGRVPVPAPSAHSYEWERGTELHNYLLHDPLTALLHALTGFCECQPPG